MVSFNDPVSLRGPKSKRPFKFVNGYSGDAFTAVSLNASDAWAALAFDQETEVADLVERGWELLFERDGGQAA
jgi:hypothetical protein